ncbi:DUF427 domain-containing protein [Aequorivita sp. CIP111184]|uniref:DUF427 domain-containing protein n=1 Tax=Aequorivita sp. CIP111184 TaxID=2211356 RepID=UPI000DBC180D|nr:DUF427 domain-containing protein [Aequorivita sp. CIP111184]SRX54207.1 hypothetical protein AEQU1_01214 [Aequorivita sp. CIP111184]
MKAIWNNKTIAETKETVKIENNHYFPSDAIKKEFFKPSNTHTHCPWKGEASYFTIEVDGKQNKDAAWYYPNPKPAADAIKNHVAFWKGVEVKE